MLDVRKVMDGIQCALHFSGIGWLTPLVGQHDGSDVQYLRSSILRDFEWASSILARDKAPAALKQVAADFAALLGQSHPGETSEFREVRHPWHLARGWTDYGAIRVAFLGSLPPEARVAALAELKNMEKVVLAGSRDRWNATLRRIETLPAQDSGIPADLLQQLWIEVDFGRNYAHARVAKHTTIVVLTWALVTLSALAIILTLPMSDPTGVSTWLVALFGLLGGSVSALRSVDIINLPERQSLEIEAVKLRLRPVVGAMSALVVYVVGRSGLIWELVASASPNRPTIVQIQVANVVWATYVLSFLAGFSERFLLGMLGKVEGRFPGSASSAGPAPNGPDGPKPSENKPEKHVEAVAKHANDNTGKPPDPGEKSH